MLYYIQHAKIGFCGYDILALALLLFVIFFLVRKEMRLRQKQKDLEDELSQIYSNHAMTMKDDY